MANIQIPDELHAELSQLAANSGTTEDHLVSAMLTRQLESLEVEEMPAIDPLVARMKNSIQELRRGEGMTTEELDAFFDSWFAEITAR
jgi:predicted transcriptional regulator